MSKDMERLTTRNRVGVAVFKVPYSCDNCNESIWRLPDYGNGSPTDRLAEYEEAEEQGLLLRLPVAIGGTIYHFEYPTRIDDKGIEWSILDKKRATIKPMKFALCHLNGIGKLYFLTKEEAEQALKQMGE